ncbi:glycoside hydrolase family 17 protein [Pseudocercospora fijiensis CIRAD86]|uniref:Glycoside hydrolase family 17 protein n=1 Tax=Pseudocercospora fijiensis (strain CIRAD86) TaxID=383855 RepID=M3A6Y1_PSEFD|nr:glycoside hydrolase family 17 protein [Pseudocercospora fijiensis CIRAD86]EME80371.1 glycoside hydrolase family 17 protein [Pseudocercospora fijiensis CIRAD86]
MRSLSLLTLASSASAAVHGFNYGALYADQSARTQQDFEADFNAAKNLPGSHGFSSARLFTMIQGYTTNTVISAIPAAIATNTSLLLGLWASAGPDAFNQEITALRNAINQYGTSFTDLIVGISVGSEDLYRVSPTGIENDSGPGSSPDQLVGYIGQVRDAIAGTAASGKSVGHVDTWTAYTNSSNAALINAVDWLGMDGYPYYQTVNANGIENAESLFFQSYDATVAVAQGKPVWVTETGWPVTGPQSGQATASIANAGTYFKNVGCRLLNGDYNIWWYQLNDGQTDQSATSFRVINADRGAPLYDLSCSSSAESSSPQAASHTTLATAVKSAAIAATSVASIQTVPNPPATTVGSAASAATSVISAPAGSQGAVQSAVQSAKPSTLVTIASSSASSAPSSAPESSDCPTNLNGVFEYPHLLVPVDSANPSKAYGTQYNGTISSTTSSIFNFDIHPDHAGKTCSVVFLFPEQKDLTSSAFTFNGKGGLHCSKLVSPANEQTTYANKPAGSGASSAISSIAPGNGYTIFTGKCEAGERVAYEFSSADGLELEYFQDYNPSPIGAYITVC